MKKNWVRPDLRKMPSDKIIVHDHAAGIATKEAGRIYGVKPMTVRKHWIRLGLPTNTRDRRRAIANQKRAATREAMSVTAFSRKLPPDPVVISDHAVAGRKPHALETLASRYGVSAKYLHLVWRRLGLSTTGRCSHIASGRQQQLDRAKKAVAAIPVLTAGATLPVPAGAPSAGHLDLDGLALAAQIAKLTGLPAAEAVAIVKADRGLA